MSKISSPVFLCYIIFNFIINSVFLVSCTNNHFPIYILRSLMNIFDIIVVVFHFTLLVVIIIKAKLQQFSFLFLFSCLFVLFCRLLLFQILFKNCRWIFSFNKFQFSLFFVYTTMATAAWIHIEQRVRIQQTHDCTSSLALTVYFYHHLSHIGVTMWPFPSSEALSSYPNAIV